MIGGRLAFAVFGAFAVWLTPVKLAGAQPARDPLAAEAAFVEARTLIKDGRWADACPRLEASLALDPAVGTLLNLAECYAHIGRTASAWLRYREAAAMAMQQGQADRESIARDRARALEGRLCRLVIAAPDRPGLVVRRDGAETAPRLPTPVDPGTHVVVAELSGRSVFQTEVAVSAPEPGHACPVTTVEVPQDLGAVPHPGGRRLAPMPSLDEDPKVPSRSGGWRPQHTLAAVSGGLALVGVAVGTVFALDAASAKREADLECPAAGCSDRGRSLNDSAGVSADIATVSFIAAGALLIGAAVLWLTAPSPVRSGPP